MNPIARLIGQAEAEIGGATQRLVNSVTDPVRAKGHVLAAEASAAVSRVLRLVLIKGALGIVAAAMAIVALVYLVAALHQALLPHFGPVETRVIMAAVFLVVALAAGLLMAFWPAGSPPVPADVEADVRHTLAASKAAVADKAAGAAKAAQAEPRREAPRATETTAEAEEAPVAAAASSLRSGVESLAGVLGAAGFRREQAGLRAGLLLANQLKPMQLVSLALIGGFLAGIRTRRR